MPDEISNVYSLCTIINKRTLLGFSIATKKKKQQKKNLVKRNMPEKRVGFFLINNLIYDITTNVSGYICNSRGIGRFRN